MPTRIYCKNSFIVCREPQTDAGVGVDVDFLGQAVSTPQGLPTAGGLILLAGSEKLTTSKSCHEVEVVASKVPDLNPGDRVIIFLGGDTTGSVNANGISAFVPVDGVEHFMVHETFVWAKVKDGDQVLPRGKVILTERDDEAFRWHTMGAASLLHLPEAMNRLGVSATGSDDPTEGGKREADSVTALYERVYRVGDGVTDLDRGETVCFSPSYSATKLRIGAKHFHLVDSQEVYFAAGV